MTLRSLKNKKVLITCGPTWVPVDNVRVISNISTGQLGQIIAAHLNAQGAVVTLLEGPVRKPLSNGRIKVIKFLFFDELAKALRQELRKKYDVLIHAAAVSDYRLKGKRSSKIRSDAANLQLEFMPTPKLISWIKKINKRIILVGFKLEPGLTRANLFAKTKKLLNEAHCDFVVANRVHGQDYSAYIVNADRKVLAAAGSRQALTRALTRVLQENI